MMAGKELWQVVFAGVHDSVCPSHLDLRAPQPYARMTVNYWWSGTKSAVKKLIRGDNRKARPKQVIPLLRSVRVG